MVGQTRPPARHRRDARKLKRPGPHSTSRKTEHYGTTLFGDGVRFDRHAQIRAFGGGRKLIWRRNKSGDGFLVLGGAVELLSADTRSAPVGRIAAPCEGASSRRRAPAHGRPSRPRAAAAFSPPRSAARACGASRCASSRERGVVTPCQLFVVMPKAPVK